MSTIEDLKTLGLEGKVRQLIGHFELLEKQNTPKESSHDISTTDNTEDANKALRDSMIKLSKKPWKSDGVRYQHPVADAAEAYSIYDGSDEGSGIFKLGQLIHYGCQTFFNPLDDLTSTYNTLSDILDVRDQQSDTKHLNLMSIEVTGYPRIGCTTVEKKSTTNSGEEEHHTPVYEKRKEETKDSENDRSEKKCSKRKVVKIKDVSSEDVESQCCVKPFTDVTMRNELPHIFPDYSRGSITNLELSLVLNNSLNQYQKSKDKNKVPLFGSPLGMTRRLSRSPLDMNKLRKISLGLPFASNETRPFEENGLIYSLSNTCVIDTFFALQMTFLHQCPYLLEDYRRYQYGAYSPYTELADMLNFYKDGKYDHCRVRWINLSGLEPTVVEGRGVSFNLYRQEGTMVFPAFSDTIDVSLHCPCSPTNTRRRLKLEKIVIYPNQRYEDDLRTYIQKALNESLRELTSRCTECGVYKAYKLDRPPPCILLNVYPVSGILKSEHLPHFLRIWGHRYRLGGVQINTSGHCTGKIWNAARGIWMYYDNADGQVFEYHNDYHDSRISIAHYFHI